MSTDKSPETLERLHKALQSKNRHERADAAIQLAETGDRAALAEIERLTEEADDLVAVAALYARWRLLGEVQSVDRMAAALASNDEETMQLAVIALGEIGEAAVPALTQELEAGSPVEIEIVRILGEIGGDDALKAIRRATDSPNEAVRREARAALAEADG